MLADGAEESVGNYDAPLMIVPTLRVGMQPVTLCVTTVSGSAQVVSEAGTPTARRGIATRSVGTIGNPVQNQWDITSRMSAANSRTRSSSVSQEHMKRAPPLPMKV